MEPLTTINLKKIFTFGVLPTVTLLALFCVLQFTPLVAEAGGGPVFNINIGAINVNLNLVDANGVAIVPAVPQPVVSVTGTDQAQWCWSGTCYTGTNQDALDFVTYYIGLIIGEYGSTYGSTILKDSAGRVVYIACANGGVVNVTYSGDGTGDVCPLDAGVQTDPSQCTCVIPDNGCQATTCNTTTCYNGCQLVTGTKVCSSPQTATLTVSPPAITLGNSTTATYSCTNAAAANLLPDYGTLPSPSGSVSISPSITTTETLNCYGASVVSTTATVTVTPPGCVWNAGMNCTSAPNMCGMTDSTGTVSCAGVCSSVTPSNGLCPVPKPDLTVTSPISPTTVTAGTPTTLTSTVTNSGTANASSFTSYVEVRHPNSTTVTNSLTLNSGSSAPASAILTFPSAGMYEARVCADGTNAVAESNEGNNCGGWTDVTVTAPGTPSITSCTPSPGLVAPGQNVTWTVTTANFSPPANRFTWSVVGGVPSSASGPSNSFTSQFAVGGAYAPSVTADHGPQSAGPTACTPVTVTGGGYSCGTTATPVISSNPNRVAPGGNTQVTYSATGIAVGTKCTVTGTNIGGPGVNSVTTPAADSSCNISTGVTNITGINNQRTYAIDCSGTKQSTIVNVVPIYKEY